MSNRRKMPKASKKAETKEAQSLLEQIIFFKGAIHALKHRKTALDAFLADSEKELETLEAAFQKLVA